MKNKVIPIGRLWTAVIASLKGHRPEMCFIGLETATDEATAEDLREGHLLNQVGIAAFKAKHLNGCVIAIDSIDQAAGTMTVYTV